MVALYVASSEPYSGKTLTCLVLGKRWQGAGLRVGYTKPLGLLPVTMGKEVTDEDAQFVAEHLQLEASPSNLCPIVLDAETCRMPVEEAEEALLRRYLHGYGPAGLRDFAAWSGMSVGEAVPVLERLVSEVVEVEVEGKRVLALREDLEELRNAVLDDGEQCVRLLPSFDCFMLGHKDKSHLVDEAYYKRVYRKAGWLSPVVLVNGRVLGVWSHKQKGKRLHITIEPFTKVSRIIHKGIHKEANDLAHLFDTICEVTFV